MRRFRNVIRVSSCVLLASLLAALTASAADQHDNSFASVSSHRTGAQELLEKPSTQTAVDPYGGLPLNFEANQGQTNSHVHFVSRGSGYSFFLTQGGSVLTFARDSSSAPIEMQMELKGANPDARIFGLDELPGTSNYFSGNNSRQWHTRIPTYCKVKYEDVYPGISLIYYGNQHQLEYDFVVAPGADPSQIRLAISGSQALTVDVNGNLVLHNAAGDIQLLAPKVYQEIAGHNRRISGQWKLASNHTAGFRIGHYDRTQPLIIDPVLTYSSFLGGSKKNALTRIAVDTAGNTYVAGYTTSGDFPTVPTAQAVSFGGGSPSRGAFVAKIDPTGSTLLYSTYLSGSGDEEATGLAIDRSGNVYVAGNTHSTDFPTHNAFQSTCATHVQAETCSSAFLTKISPTGDSLLFSTYFGGSGGESARSLALDAAGNAYVAGVTSSLDFPVTSGAAQAKCGGTCRQNAFVAKFDPSGSSLAYATYLGGSGVDDAADIAVDASGNVYVAGRTTSPDFPVAMAYQKSCAADAANTASCVSTAFVTKINADASAFAYSTYLGGSLGSQASAIAVDSVGSAYVTGSTESRDFPVMKPFQKSCGIDASTGQCSVDAFLTKLAPSGKTLVYSTYLGGAGRDEASGIVVDSAGNAHVVGRTESADFPMAAPVQSKLKGASDAFVARFNAAGSSLTFSTYHGGSSVEAGNGIALDAKGNVYLTGETSSPDFPVHHPFQSSCAGSCASAFVSQMAPPPAIAVSVAPNPGSVEVDNALDFTANVTGTLNTAVTWSLAGSVCSGAACGSLSSTTANPVTYTAPASIPAGTITLTATAQADGTTTGSSAIDLTDFKVTLNPTSGDVAPGGSTTTTLTAAAFNANGYSGTLTPSCAGLPTGATCSFNPATITLPGTGTSTLTINTTSSTPAGAHVITVNVVDGATVAVTHSKTFTLNVVTVSVAPTTSTVEVNNTQAFTATVVPAQSVTWSLSGANCSGATCGTVSPITTASGTPTTYTAPNAAPLGTITLTATTSGGINGTATITVTDYSVSLNPTSADVAPGASTTTTLTAAAFNANGYSGTITPSCTGLPTGVTCSFNPTTISLPGTGTSTVTIQTSSNTPGGAHTITVSAVDAAGVQVTHTTPFTLNVVTITVTPASATVEVNNTRSFTATVNPPRTINWSLSGSGCSGATCGTVNPTTGNTTTYTAPSAVPTSTVTLTASASGGFTGAATITVSDYSLSLNPTARDVLAGTSTTTTLTATATNGYTGTITPSCTGLPAGVTCSFSPATITLPGTGTSTLTINTTGSTTTGPHAITISGVDSATVPVTHTTPFSLTVVTITIAPSSATVKVNNTSSFTGTVVGLASTTVNWSLSGANCSGATCGTVNPATTPDGATPTTYTAPGTAPLGTVQITATAADGLSTSVPITVTDFKLNLSSASGDVGPSGSTNTTLTASAFNANGYTGTLTPSCSSGLPTGASCSFNGTTMTVPGSPSSTLTISTSGTPAGIYPITLQVVDPAPVQIAHTITFTLHVVTVVVAPKPSTIEVNQNTDFTGTVTGLTDTSVNWTVSGSGCSGSSCGSISPATTANGTTPTTYTSPTSPIANLSTEQLPTVTITGTANGDAAFSDNSGAIPITDFAVIVPSSTLVVTQSVTGVTQASAFPINQYAPTTIPTAQCSVTATTTFTGGPTCSTGALNVGTSPTPTTVSIDTGTSAASAPVGIYTATVTGTDAVGVVHSASQLFSVQCGLSLQKVAPTFTPANGQQPSVTPNSYSIGVSVLQGGSACPYGDSPVVGGVKPDKITTDSPATLQGNTNGSASSSQPGSVTVEMDTVTTPTMGDVKVSTFDATQGGSQTTLVMPIGAEAPVPQTAGVGTTQVSLPITLFSSGTLNIGGNSNPVCGVVDADGNSDSINFGISCSAPATTSLPAGSVGLTLTISSTSAAARMPSRPESRLAVLYAVSLGFPALVFVGLGLSSFGPQHRKHGLKRATCFLGILLIVSALVVLPGCGGGFKATFEGNQTNSDFTVTVFSYVTDSSGNVTGVDVFSVPLTLNK